MTSSFSNILLDNSFNFDYPPDIHPTPFIKNIVTPQVNNTTPKSISCMEKFIDEKYDKIKNVKQPSDFLPTASSSVEKSNSHFNSLAANSLENQIESLKSEIYFLREEMREKNYIIKNLLKTIDLKSNELMNDYSCLKPKSKINEILDELNRTNKSLNDLSKAITLHSPKEGIIKNTCDLNGSSFDDTKSSLSQTNFILNHTKANSCGNGETISNPRSCANVQEINSNINDDRNNINPFTSDAFNNQHTSSTNSFTPTVVGNKSNITHRAKNVDKYYKDLDKCAKDVDFDINSRDIVNNKNDNINHDKISKINATNTDDSNNTTNNNAINNDDSNNHRDNGNIEDINGKISTDVDKDTAKAKANSDLKTDRKEVEGRKAIFIVGDSVIKELKGFELSKSIGHKKPVKVRSHPSAQIRCLTDHIQPIIRNKDAEHILLHIGTNDLKSEKTPVQICHDIINLTAAIRDKGIKVSVSGIIQRNDHLNNKVLLVNESLKKICESVGIPFVNNGNIRPDLHLNASKVHLNRKGNNIFINNIRKFCKSV